MNKSVASLKRRQFLLGTAGLALTGMAGGGKVLAQASRAGDKTCTEPAYKHGLCRTVLGGEMTVEECCRVTAELGAKGLDFFSDPRDWPVIKSYGLTVSMLRADHGGGKSTLEVDRSGPPGWHAIGLKAAQNEYLTEIRRLIDVASDNGFPNLAVFAGTRHEVSYEEGADNAVEFFNKVKAHAEDRGVTLCMELVNSKMQMGPPLSLFDNTAWGVDVVKRVDSPSVKILYDFFHAQLMEGDLADTFRNNVDYIGHVHTGGVPGRHELDDTQEINYGFLGRVIRETGYSGFVTHEWMPSAGSDRIALIRKSMDILDCG